jgi:high-affinity iron transporter
MLATFVIGLREGLEAALIVGIVAAFLRQRGAAASLRWVWIGVAAAVAICLTIGVVLQVVSANLPEGQQEGLETVIGAVAVVMVTYMVIWMRRHSRDMKRQLEGVAGSALATGSSRALVAMAFLAVLREGIETAVFLLAAFNASHNGVSAGLGALLGVLVATLLGYGIYRGGVKLNLSRFFRATGVVLVLVAAGLVVTALHTAHEAGWLNAGQDQVLDISGLVRSGSVQSSLLTGVLGLQPTPTEIEVIGWLVYLVPLGLYVAWPPGKRVPRRPIAWGCASLAVGCAAGAIAFAVAAPAKPDTSPQRVWTTPVTGTTTSSVNDNGFTASQQQPTGGAITWSTIGARTIGSDQRAGVATVLSARDTATVLTDLQLPARVTLDQLRQLNGGRLPIGVQPSDVKGLIPVTYTQTIADQFWRDPGTGRLLDASRHVRVTAAAQLTSGPLVLESVRGTTQQPTPQAAATAAAFNRSLRVTASRAESWGSDYPTLLGVAAALLIATTIGAAWAQGRLKQRSPVTAVALPANDARAATDNPREPASPRGLIETSDHQLPVR